MILFRFFDALEYGRLDKSLMSQQMLMELFVTEATGAQWAWKSPEGFADLSDWVCIEFDEENNVSAIDWGSFGLQGRLGWQWLPESLKVMQLWRNAIEGELDLSMLPRKLVIFIADNNLFGSLNLTELPPLIQTLHLSWNNFSGIITLEQLPSKIRELHVRDNKLCGTVCLTKLPESLNSLDISHNGFFGELDFRCLSNTLENLRISSNDFSGELNVRFPPGMHNFDMTDTKLIGTVFFNPGLTVTADSHVKLLWENV